MSMFWFSLVSMMLVITGGPSWFRNCWKRFSPPLKLDLLICDCWATFCFHWEVWALSLVASWLSDDEDEDFHIFLYSSHFSFLCKSFITWLFIFSSEGFAFLPIIVFTEPAIKLDHRASIEVTDEAKFLGPVFEPDLLSGIMSNTWKTFTIKLWTCLGLLVTPTGVLTK